MGFIIFFAVVFIIVLAFKSSKKEETITKTDQETGKTTIETRVTDTPSTGQTAARTVLWIIGIVIVVVLMLAVCGSMM